MGSKTTEIFYLVDEFCIAKEGMFKMYLSTVKKPRKTGDWFVPVFLFQNPYRILFFAASQLTLHP